MSDCEADRIRARQDRLARAEARKARHLREEAREEARRAELKAAEQRIVAEAKAAQAAGLMKPPKKARAQHGPAGSGQGGERVSAVIARAERRQHKAAAERKAIEAARDRNKPVLGHRVVDDPLNPGSKTTAVVDLAEHPLEMMLARHRLSPAHYEAGARYRRIYEQAVIGPGRGIDPSKIKVDGGTLVDPHSDAVVHAQLELARLSREIGMVGDRILSAVIGHGVPIADLAESWPGREALRKKRHYLTLRFEEALEVLATQVWGATGPQHGRIIGERDLGSNEIDAKAVAVANQTYLRKRGIVGSADGNLPIVS